MEKVLELENMSMGKSAHIYSIIRTHRANHVTCKQTPRAVVRLLQVNVVDDCIKVRTVLRTVRVIVVADAALEIVCCQMLCDRPNLPIAAWVSRYCDVPHPRTILQPSDVGTAVFGDCEGIFPVPTPTNTIYVI